MSATIGILTGVIGGVILIQWAARRGHARALDGADASLSGVSGLLTPAERRPIAFATVGSTVIEPMTLHFAVAMLAVLIGWGFQAGLSRLHPAFDSMPIFTALTLRSENTASICAVTNAEIGRAHV